MADDRPVAIGVERQDPSHGSKFGEKGFDDPGRQYVVDHYARLGLGARVRLTRIHGETPSRILPIRLYLPAVLNEITITETAEFTDFQTHRRGEYSIPAQGGAHARNLRELPFDALTLDWHAPWLVAYRKPHVIQDELTNIIRSKKPVMLAIFVRPGGGHHTTEFRGPVTLRQVERTLRPGEADTRYWTIEFKEWRNLRGKRLSRLHPRSKEFHEPPTTYRLRASTTLHWLSKHFYGSYKHWREIARANGIHHWGSRTALVKMHRYHVGDRIKIPGLRHVANASDDAKQLPGAGGA